MSSDNIPLNYTINQNDRTVSFTGTFIAFSDYAHVIAIAANPIDSMTTYAGSGLPFPCEDIAFENTPNVLQLTSPNFQGVFKYPNSYYEYDNWTKIPPSIFIVATRHDGTYKKWQQVLPDPLLLRSLNHRPTFYKGPKYYSDKEYRVPMASAEATMRNIKVYKEQYNAAI